MRFTAMGIWFAAGCFIGLAVMNEEPAPRTFPPSYGRSPVQYFEPTDANEYRFDI
jgi:hypothetical protein